MINRRRLSSDPPPFDQPAFSAHRRITFHNPRFTFHHNETDFKRDAYPQLVAPGAWLRRVSEDTGRLDTSYALTLAY